MKKAATSGRGSELETLINASQDKFSHVHKDDLKALGGLVLYGLDTPTQWMFGVDKAAQGVNAEEMGKAVQQGLAQAMEKGEMEGLSTAKLLKWSMADKSGQVQRKRRSLKVEAKDVEETLRGLGPQYIDNLLLDIGLADVGLDSLKDNMGHIADLGSLDANDLVARGLENMNDMGPQDLMKRGMKVGTVK